jgi:serine/threonine-protein kinase
VLRDSLLGLAAAHRHGVAHRALKPQNVLISADGDGKLSDFGIAVRAEDSRVPAGTMVYAPPERLGGSPASPAGDVYAATAVFYECLAGRPPFARDTAERLVYQHLAEPVPLEPVPGPLRPLVAAGLATEPSNRPSDGSAFVTELTAVAAGAYGLDWQERGRSHLGEAALPLVTARWPSSSARPAVRDHGGYRFRRITGRRAVIAVGGVAAAAIAGTALAVSGPGAGTTASSVAAVQRVSLQPSARKPAATSAVPSSVSSPAAVQTSSPTRSSIPSGPALSPQPTPSRKPSGKPKPSPSPSPSVTPHPPSPLPVTPPPVTPPPAPAPSPPSAPTSPPPSGLLGAAPIDL